jgi:hypothetical protein
MPTVIFPTGDNIYQVVVTTPTYELVAPDPISIYKFGTMYEYHITADGTDVDLTLDEDILLPSDSGVVFPKTLENGKTYIVALKWGGASWWLVTLVGGYSS